MDCLGSTVQARPWATSRHSLIDDEWLRMKSPFPATRSQVYSCVVLVASNAYPLSATYITSTGTPWSYILLHNHIPLSIALLSISESVQTTIGYRLHVYLSRSQS
jgi:hypothetical protein